MKDRLSKQPWQGLVFIAFMLLMWNVILPLFYREPVTMPSRGMIIAVVIGYSLGVLVFDLLPELFQRQFRRYDRRMARPPR